MSLFEMLEFSATDFHAISSTLTQLQSQAGLLLMTPDGKEEFHEKMTSLHQHATNLKMGSTLKQIGYMTEYFQNGGKVRSEIVRMLEELQRRIQEDLEARIILAVTLDKNDFYTGDWLNDSKIGSSFPHTALPELQAASRCYSYDEDTACMFHLMRVLDFGFKLVAGSLGISYDNRNWVGIGQAIQSRMEKKYQEKTDNWRKAEPLYATILTDIQAVSRGHRNPVLHELDKQYDAKASYYMLIVTEAFTSHLAENGFIENQSPVTAL
jgi:hypothetical protein